MNPHYRFLDGFREGFFAGFFAARAGTDFLTPALTGFLPAGFLPAFVVFLTGFRSSGKTVPLIPVS